MAKQAVASVEFQIGHVPDWYEDRHDFHLEEWLDEFITDQFGGNVNVAVSYHYEGRSLLASWNQNGVLMSEIPFDLNGALASTKGKTD